MGKPHVGQPTALLAESLVDSGMFRIFPSLGTSSQIYAVTVQGHASRKGTSLVKKKKMDTHLLPWRRENDTNGGRCRQQDYTRTDGDKCDLRPRLWARVLRPGPRAGIGKLK